MLINLIDFNIFDAILRSYEKHSELFRLSPVLVELLMNIESKQMLCSHTQHGQESGFKNRSYLRLIVNGHRNISARALEKLIFLFGLNEQESKYFRVLVRFNQAKTVVERDSAYHEISIFPTKKRKDDCPTIMNFRHWCPRIYALISIDGVKRDIESLCSYFDITQKEIETPNLEVIRAGEERDGGMDWSQGHALCRRCHE